MRIWGLETGNGWIVGLIYLAVMYVPMFFGGRAAKRLVDFSFATMAGKMNSVLTMLLCVGMIVYPLFLKIRFGTTAFHLGLALFIIGGIATVASFISYFSTPLDRTICKGMYKISRNPIYFFVTVTGFGMALMLHSAMTAVIVAASANMFFFVKEPQRVLNEIFRVVRPGGRFAMVTMGNGMVGKITFGWLYSLKTYSDSMMTMMLKQAGFNSVKVKSGMSSLQMCYAEKT